MTISFEPGAAYLARRPIIDPLDDTHVLHPNVPTYWVCPIHMLLDEYPREFVADVMVDYGFGEIAVKSRALRICALLNRAITTMERDHLLTIIEGLAPRAVGKLINGLLKSRKVDVPDSAAATVGSSSIDRMKLSSTQLASARADH